MTTYPAAASTLAAGKGPIAKLFTTCAGEDQPVLNRARRCAAMTKPHILPPQGQTASTQLPENFQSIGAMGTTTLVGKMLLALFPPDQPWFQLVLDGAIQTSRAVSDQDKQVYADVLFLRELLIQALLESAGVDEATNRRPAGFRSQMRSVIEQAVITGDSLFRITDDFRVVVYGRQQYVVRRDSAGDPLFYVVCESIDPLSLDKDAFAKSQINREELAGKTASERMVPIHTRVEWMPEAGGKGYWKIEQEINGNTVNESEERVTCPYISVPFDLVAGEHYGRGYIEVNLLGDLRAIDNLNERVQHHAALASENKWCKDASSLVRPEDLAKPPGSVIEGARVLAGEVQDIALLKANNIGDFSVAEKVLDRKERSAGRAFLMETETAPKGEAGRSPRSWERIAMELEGGLGGLYAPIADYMQVPIVRRVNHLVERQRLGTPLPRSVYKVQALTGIAALGRAATGARIEGFAATLQALGPEAASWINQAVLINVMARYRNIYEPGLTKTPEEKARETQAAIAAQTQLAAGQKAVDVAGNVAEAALTPQGP